MLIDPSCGIDPYHIDSYSQSLPAVLSGDLSATVHHSSHMCFISLAVLVFFLNYHYLLYIN